MWVGDERTKFVMDFWPEHHSRRCQVSEFCDRPKRQSAGSQQVRYTGVCMYVREAYQWRKTTI